MRTTVAAIAVAGATASAQAQPAPGAEFLVNTYTTHSQGYAAAASDGRGRFVVAWQSSHQDGDRGGIFARLFDRRGMARGPEIPVNTITADNQLFPTVAADAAGNFVVAWRRIVQGTLRMAARRFDRTGTALGPEFLVGNVTADVQFPGSVSMQPDGRVLITWAQNSLPRVTGRHFDAAGNPVGSELALSAGTGAAGDVRAVAGPNGTYLVTWGGFDAMGDAVFGRRVGAAGLPIGAEFRINSTSAGYEYGGRGSFDASGGFVVAWHKGPNGIDVDVFARRFDPAGAPIGGEFRVNSDLSQRHCCPNVAADRDGGFTVLWTGNNVDFDVYARRFDASGTPVEGEFVVPADSTFFQIAGEPARAPGGHLVAVYDADLADGDLGGVLGRLLGIVPMAMVVDAAPMQSNGNGVLEAGETVAVAPSWANADRFTLAPTGTLSSLTGPGSATYTITDGSAAYGTVAVGSTSPCTSTADCYALSVSAPPSRPALHWDAAVRERVTPRGDMDWSLHVGGSFTDVPLSNGFYAFVETLLHHGVTAGCAADTYCPAAVATREQMAVFVLSAHEGAGYQPRACGTPVFLDVPASSPFCRFIEELARRGVVGGCGGGHYCAGSPVTREEMAVFVLRTKEPELTPPACTTPVFTDVPASSPFCPWIEELARRNVVSGCGGGRYCPTDAVTRDQMAVFISGGFGLSLYGP